MAHSLHHPSLLLSIPSPSICLNICTLSFSSSLLFHSHTVTLSSSHPIQSISFFLISFSISSHVFQLFLSNRFSLRVYTSLFFLSFSSSFMQSSFVSFVGAGYSTLFTFLLFFSYYGLSCFAMVKAKSAGTPLFKHRPHPKPQESS